MSPAFRLLLATTFCGDSFPTNTKQNEPNKQSLFYILGGIFTQKAADHVAGGALGVDRWFCLCPRHSTITCVRSLTHHPLPLPNLIDRSLNTHPPFIRSSFLLLCCLAYCSDCYLSFFWVDLPVRFEPSPNPSHVSLRRLLWTLRSP